MLINHFKRIQYRQAKLHFKYLSDGADKTTAIQIPIDGWDWLKEMHLEFQELSSAPDVQILDWEFELRKIVLENTLLGKTKLVDWESVRNKFKI